jgi:type II secretory pathway pseudopilin PulG
MTLRTARRNRSEAGDTLIEVLLAIVVLGVASLALLIAFGVSITASAEHRNLATMDTVLRTASEEAESSLQGGLAPAYVSCGTAAYYQTVIGSAFSLPTTPAPGYTATVSQVQYWNSTTNLWTSTCAANSYGPQLIYLTVAGPSGTSSTINFVVGDPRAVPAPTCGTATRLAFMGPLSQVAAGSPISPPPVVEVEDGNLNNCVVTNDLSQVSLAITSGTGTLTNCLASEFFGVVTYSNCMITTAGTYTLTATDGTLTSATSTLTVVAAAPAQLAFGVEPPATGATGGVAWSPQPTVTVLDAFGNVTSDTSTVSLAVTLGTGPGVLTCSSNAVAAVNGTATFAGCAVNTAGSGYTLTATDGTLTSATSTAFAVAIGPASQLAFIGSPASATGGTAFTSQPAVAIEDAGGNIVTSNTSAVTLSIGTNPAAGTLSCTSANPINAISGIATFAGCAINKVGTGYTLKAVDALVTTTSSPFNVLAGTATQLLFSIQPVGGVNEATNLATQPQVTFEDAGGNVATSATGTVTLSVSSYVAGDGGSTKGTVTNASVSAVAGVATFISSQITGTAAAGTYALQASSGSLATVPSSSVSITAAPLSTFSVPTPSAQTAGTAFSETITALDAFGNGASGWTSTSACVAFSGLSNSPTYPAAGSCAAGSSSLSFNSAGQATAVITPVEAQSTSLTVTSVSTPAGIVSSSGIFVVSAGLTVSPANDPIGSTGVTLTGAGFVVGKTVSVTFGGNTLALNPATPLVASNGTWSATFTVPSSTAGAKTITATDSGGVSASTTFTVAKTTPTDMVSNSAPTTIGSSVTFTATLSGPTTTPTGTVTWSVSGTAGVASCTTSTTTLSGGSATCTLTVPNAGTYVVADTYAPGADPNYLATTSANDTVTVTKTTPSDVVTNSTPVTAGSSATFTATLTGPAGATAPTGTVTWSVSGTAGITSCTTSTTTLSSGIATCHISPASTGTLIVSDSYAPGADPNYLATASNLDTVNVGFGPNLLQIESKSGGTAGKIQGGDHLGVTFPVPLTAATVCAGKTTSFSITGTVTIGSNTAPSTGNDDLTFSPAASQCTGNATGFASGSTGQYAGYIDLGSTNFVSATATIANSTLSFDATTNNIQILFGTTLSGGGTLGTVTTATGIYFPDAAIQSNGVSASGSVSATNIFSVQQPSAASIASGVTSPNGTPSTGDPIIYTFSEQMDPNSILAGWNGSSTAVTACFSRSGFNATVLTIETSSACSTAVSLGTVSLGDPFFGWYIGTSGGTIPLSATMAMATVGGQSVVTVTLTSSNASFNAVTSNTQWTWSPAAGAADLAGNPSSTTAPPASPSKENF